MVVINERNMIMSVDCQIHLGNQYSTSRWYIFASRGLTI